MPCDLSVRLVLLPLGLRYVCFISLEMRLCAVVGCSGVGTTSYDALCILPLLTLRLLMSYIYGAPSKDRNANVVYIWTYVWQR